MTWIRHASTRYWAAIAVACFLSVAVMSAAAVQAPADSPVPILSDGGSSIPYAILGHGHVAGVEWGIATFRGRALPSNRPCLVEIFRSDIPGGSSSGVSCGRLAPPGWPIYTLNEISQGFPDGRRREATILGMTFSPRVVEVLLDLGHGQTLRRKTQILGSVEASRAEVDRFRYIALSIPRAVCLEGVTGYNRRERVILKTTRYDCTGPSIEQPGSTRPAQ